MGFEVKEGCLHGLLVSFKEQSRMLGPEIRHLEEIFEGGNLAAVLFFFRDKCAFFGGGVLWPLHDALESVEGGTKFPENALEGDFDLLAGVEGESGCVVISHTR